MDSIYLYKDYKKYVNDWIKQRPQNGRGQLQKMAKHLGVHSTMMSHVFKRDTHLSEEQSCVLTEYLGLNEQETHYFINLVQLARAGSKKLKDILAQELEKKRQLSQEVKSRIKDYRELKESDKAIFYSSWHYSAIRLLANLDETNSVDQLQERLKLPRTKLNKILDFLISVGILKLEGEVYKTGISKIHLSADSPFIWKHHQNWRIKAMERYQKVEEDELMFTSPLTIGEKDIPIVKEKILGLIESVSQTVEKTEPDTLCCLNIDWVKIS